MSMSRFLPFVVAALSFGCSTHALQNIASAIAAASAPPPAGEVREDIFASDALGVRKHVMVYLPASYGTDTTRRYPVVYYLHGLFGTETDWASKGSIVAITTAATRRYPVRDGLSSGTKGAVEAVVRALAAEEGRFGVRANCVGPGMMTDGMAQRLMASGDLDDAALEITKRNIPLRRFGDAVDIAEAVCFLASDRADFISGQMLDVDGAYGV